MHPTYFESALAFLGLASIVAGAFADRLAEFVLQEPKVTSSGRSQAGNQPRPFGA